jgi:nicotinamide mononucleotide transporter
VTLPPYLSQVIEILAMVTGVGYAVLAARRNRLCWVAGAVSSAATAVTAGSSALPIQAGLQVYYVAVSIYGWFNWKRSSDSGELPVGVWPLARHLAAAVVLTVLSLVTARLIAFGMIDDWPLLDSLTAWFSLLATWLQARACLENWLYWVVIDVVLVFVFFAQQKYWLALLMALYIVIASSGYIAWRRRLQTQVVTA